MQESSRPPPGLGHLDGALTLVRNTKQNHDHGFISLHFRDGYGYLLGSSHCHAWDVSSFIDGLLAIMYGILIARMITHWMSISRVENIPYSSELYVAMKQKKLSTI